MAPIVAFGRRATERRGSVHLRHPGVGPDAGSAPAGDVEPRNLVHHASHHGSEHRSGESGESQDRDHQLSSPRTRNGSHAEVSSSSKRSRNARGENARTRTDATANNMWRNTRRGSRRYGRMLFRERRGARRDLLLAVFVPWGSDRFGERNTRRARCHQRSRESTGPAKCPTHQGTRAVTCDLEGYGRLPRGRPRPA